MHPFFRPARLTGVVARLSKPMRLGMNRLLLIEAGATGGSRRADRVVWIETNPVRQQSEREEVELLRRVAEGDWAAFGRLYDCYATPLFSLAVRILNDPKEAEDVLQEVFLQIWDKAPGFDPALGKPFNWALTFTRNKAIDRLRGSQRRQRLSLEMTVEANTWRDASGSAPDEIERDERTTLIRTAMAALPAEQRQAIEMAFFSGLTQTEIAEALKQPLGTVKARIRRGMLRLRDSLEKPL
jgi:RNA polymerase sigma-70 factor, ECF subfamily